MVAMLEEFAAENAPDAEVWVVNRSFMHQKNADRVYFFDNIDDFHEDWIKELNELEGVRIITRDHYEEIPASEKYPIDEVISHFGLQYFVCTVAYMIAHAIYEGVDKITLVGMYHPSDSMEYLHHIPCINWWVGVAYGAKNIEIEVVGNSMIGKPFPWQPKCYGYIRQRNEVLANQTMSAAYRASIGYPICFCHPNGEPYDAKGQMDAVIEMMPDGKGQVSLVELAEDHKNPIEGMRVEEAAEIPDGS
jgi:hypothetical protein